MRLFFSSTKFKVYTTIIAPLFVFSPSFALKTAGVDTASALSKYENKNKSEIQSELEYYIKETPIRDEYFGQLLAQNSSDEFSGDAWGDSEDTIVPLDENVKKSSNTIDQMNPSSENNDPTSNQVYDLNSDIVSTEQSTAPEATEEIVDLRKPAEPSGPIEIIKTRDPYAPYSMRRQFWAFDFRAGMEMFAPNSYESFNHPEAFYDETVDSGPMQFFTIGGGIRLNFPVVTWVHGFKFSSGNTTLVSSYEGSEVESELDIYRYQYYTGLIFDDIFQEPYVAPYAEIGVNQFTFSDDGDLDSDSGKLSPSFSYAVGIMIQLNAFDSHNSVEGRRYLGPENAYLDLFINQSMASSNEDDPDFSTPVNYGLGLRLEF